MELKEKKDFEKYFSEKIMLFSNLNHKGNNQLFKISTDKANYLLKKYSKMHMDNWKRGISEFKAIDYLWKKGIREIPKPISFYEEDNIAVYSFEEGKILNPEEVKSENVIKAADFLLKLHSLGIEDKRLFQPASSACLSLLEYMNVIDRRLKNIINYEPTGKNGLRARNFLDNVVCPKIEEIKFSFLNNVKGVNITQELGLEEQVLTPADFGFHNILVHKEKHIFIDFEYFGRDDPARQILDFIHHDKSIKIKKEMKQNFIDRYIARGKPYSSFEERLHLTDPLVGMTWVLIYLNILSGDYINHVKFAHGDIGNIVEERLIKAENKLSNLKYFK